MTNLNENTEAEKLSETASPSECLIMNNFNSAKDNPPPTGTLCVVYFPIGVNNITKKTAGAAAVAYKTDGGWKMADVPSGLRGIMAKTGPAYWCRLIIDHDV